MGIVINLFLISRALVITRVSPLFSLWGGRGVERDLGNEVVVKQDGCTQAIVEPLCEKIMSWRELGINYSQAFGSKVYHSLPAFIERGVKIVRLLFTPGRSLWQNKLLENLEQSTFSSMVI